MQSKILSKWIVSVLFNDLPGLHTISDLQSYRQNLGRISTGPLAPKCIECRTNSLPLCSSSFFGSADIKFLLVYNDLPSISECIRECKLTAVRSLQYCCLFLQPFSRHVLQVLVRFIVRLSSNHSIVLSDDLPTRELVRVLDSFLPLHLWTLLFECLILSCPHRRVGQGVWCGAIWHALYMGVMYGYSHSISEPYHLLIDASNYWPSFSKAWITQHSRNRFFQFFTMRSPRFWVRGYCT